jgi:integrase
MMTLAKEARLMFGELPKIKTRKVWPRSVAMSLADSELIAAKMTGDARDVFRTLRGTGMRPSECYAMRWEFLSLDRGEYKNPHGKTTTARRSCPLLHDSLVTLQRRHLAQGMPREGWVFPSDSVTGQVVPGSCVNFTHFFKFGRKNRHSSQKFAAVDKLSEA